MRHVFVETNWVFGCAAPAHHRIPDAVSLLKRSRTGELHLLLPSPCLTEARKAILTKCQPRQEADAIRRFLRRSIVEGKVSKEDDRIVRQVLGSFEQQVDRELRQLDDTLASLRREVGLEIFAPNERMLDRIVNLSGSELFLQPFDQAILGSVLVRAEELLAAGETDLCFCEIDADLQPWDKHGNPKQPLAGLYDSVRVWVYGNFELDDPDRPDNWPE